MTDIYASCESREAFVQDMKSIYYRFIKENEEGEEELNTHTHKWTIDYIGKLEKSPAEYDEEGNLISEATYWDGDRVNIRLHDEEFEKDFMAMLEAGEFDHLPNNTEFITPQPKTPNRTFA